MLSVEEALKLIAQHARSLMPRRVPLGEASGLILAEDVVSEINSPPYDKSMMDGYAVRSADREPQRQVLEEIAAGAVPQLPVTPGCASRIMTGAPIPEGADAVVPIEKTKLLDGGIVQLDQVDPASGQHVLPLGVSMRAGDIVLCKGAEIRPIEIAILAEIGRSSAEVRPRPRVAILATGNELLALGEKPGPGQIQNSNGPMLVAAAVRAHAEPMELGIARDNRDDLTRWIEQGLAADVLILSGGVSAGAFDLVPSVLAELGVQQVFHEVSLRPGKPLWFGAKCVDERNVLVFGLPGNPVSSLVCFELFVRPAIAALSGRDFAKSATVKASLSHPYDHNGGRAACLPARIRNASGKDPLPVSSNFDAVVSGTLAVEILPWQGSADLAALARANGLARLSDQPGRLEPGTLLDVILL